MPNEPPAHRLIVNALPLLGNLTGVGQMTAAICREFEAREGFDIAFRTAQGTYPTMATVGDSIPGPGLDWKDVAHSILHRMPFKHQIKKGIALVKPRPRPDAAPGPREETYDSYWEPNFIPLSKIVAKKVVATVHDMSWREHPEWHPRDRAAYFADNFFKQIELSDIVVAVSGFTRDRFLDSRTQIGPDRVRVIPNGVDLSIFRRRDELEIRTFRTRFELPEDFILCVGSIEPRKNLLRLLDAFSILPQNIRKAYPLVLVGDSGWKNQEVRQRVNKMGNAVRVIPYIENTEDLARIYSAATLFVYPSLYEGFGMPPLEAMACGTPVCLSDIPVFQEVYPPTTACFVDPLSPESIAAGLEQMLENRNHCEQQRAEGLQLARSYSWSHAAEAYANLFEELGQG